MNNLEEKKKFLERYNLSRLNLEEIERNQYEEIWNKYEEANHK